MKHNAIVRSHDSHQVSWNKFLGNNILMILTTIDTQNLLSCFRWCYIMLATSNVTTERWHTQEFFRGSTDSVEDRGQRERGSGGSSLLVRCSAQFANEKPIFLLGHYGCIFHRTGNLARHCQNFEILGGVWTPPNTPPPPSVRHCNRVHIWAPSVGWNRQYKAGNVKMWTVFNHLRIFSSSALLRRQ
jgi:hypothetical protein